MRLVRDDGDAPLPALRPDLHALLAELVRELLSGAGVRISLDRPAAPDIPGTMSLPATPEGRKDSAPAPAVLGRINSTETELSLAVEVWLNNLAARGKSELTVRGFRQVVTAAARDRKWTHLDQLAGGEIIEYLDAQRGAGYWTGTTYNRNLSCFRSLTRFLKRTKRLAEDPLAEAERAEDDRSDGARAAELPEALALMALAHDRKRVSRRFRANAALQRALGFLHGCRRGEPEKMQWKHVLLDVAVPHVHWTKKISKNRREQFVALAPELVDRLLEHREEMRTLARTTPVVIRRTKGGKVNRRGVSPDDPEAFVFPVFESKHQWRKDRDHLAIPAADMRGRPFTPHSARKFFQTYLDLRLRVSEKMIDFLMRHRGRPEHRYYDPPLADQLEALRRLPPMWPILKRPRLPTSESGHAVDNLSAGNVDLTAGLVDVLVPTRHRAADQHDSPRNAGPASLAPVSQPVEETGPALPIESLRAALPWSGSAPLRRPETGTPEPSCPTMPRVGHENGDLRDVADILAALERLLRRAAHAGPKRSKGRSAS